MKNAWDQPVKPVAAPVIVARPPEEKKELIILECLYGRHKAELLHRGTAYCRACYDRRNPTGELVG